MCMPVCLSVCLCLPSYTVLVFTQGIFTNAVPKPDGGPGVKGPQSAPGSSSFCAFITAMMMVMELGRFFQISSIYLSINV